VRRDATTKEEITKFRAITATANYSRQDRPDIAYATKAASTRMAGPSEKYLALLKGMGRCLIEKPRVRQWFERQSGVQKVNGYTDSDWAGCTETRQSTSGGVLMHGYHVCKTYGKTKNNIA